MTKPIDGNTKPLETIDPNIDQNKVNPETADPAATPAKGADAPAQPADTVIPQAQVDADHRAQELAGEADVVRSGSGLTGDPVSTLRASQTKSEIMSLLKKRFRNLCTQHNLSPNDVKLSMTVEFSADGRYAHATVNMDNSRFDTTGSAQTEIVDSMNRYGGGRLLGHYLQQNLGIQGGGLSEPAEGAQMQQTEFVMLY